MATLRHASAARAGAYYATTNQDPCFRYELGYNTASRSSIAEHTASGDNWSWAGSARHCIVLLASGKLANGAI